MNTTLLVVQHVDREGPDLIGTLARDRGMAIQIVRPDQEDPLPNPMDCPNTVALVLGGPMGVNERHHPGLDWLQRELLMSEGIPVDLEGRLPLREKLWRPDAMSGD